MSKLSDNKSKTNKTLVSLDGGASRLNSGKLPMHLVPTSAIKALASALQYGANKYEERNWERGFKWSIPYACAQRHLLSWWEGEDKDEESGLSHLHHALINIAMLVEFENTFTEGDDRVKKEKKEGDIWIPKSGLKVSDLDEMATAFEENEALRQQLKLGKR